MKRSLFSSASRLVLALALPVVAGGTASCGSDGFATPRNPPRLVVELLDPPSATGTAEQPLDLKIGSAVAFNVVVRAVTSAGLPDTSFTRYVRLASKPGAIEPLVGDSAEGRNVLLTNGESAPVEVRVTNAYGITYVVADDLGYVPADPLRDPPPSCSNGIDDDGDGAIDFPADEGCAFANDDAEEGGSFAQGASRPIFFRRPRIADVRGLICAEGRGCSGNGRTPYPREQIQLDTGYRESDGVFLFDTVVTRLSSDGFYVADLGDKRLPIGAAAGSFTNVFAFNFNAPPRMRVCDRMKTYGGTATEFFGFTQISYPTWTLEEWDPARRLCLVPEAERLSPSIISNTSELLRLSGSLVRVQTTSDNVQKAKVTPKFGPGDAQKGAGTGAGYLMTPDATNCDFDKNGRINSFVPGDPEGDCSTTCTADAECTEWSNFASRGTFRITVTDSNGTSNAIQADSSASAGFNPVAAKGVPIRSFTGTLHFFSGGSQYTIEARCKDDIILALEGAPFGSDKACTTDAECDRAAGLPPGFKCVQLDTPGSPKACRSLQPNQLDPSRPEVKEPPPLACVFPRTFLDNNPQ